MIEIDPMCDLVVISFLFIKKRVDGALRWERRWGAGARERGYDNER